MHFRLLLLLILLVPTVVQAQTVTKVIDGVTVGLDSGEIVKLKGFRLPSDPAESDKARRYLTSYVLDRPVTLEDSVELGWGQTEAIVKWRGVDIGNQLKQRGVVRSSSVESAPIVPSIQPAQSIQASPPVQYYYVPQRQYYYPDFSSYTPSSAYCVGST